MVGIAVAGPGFTLRAIDAICDNSNLRTSERLLLVVYAKHADGKGEAYPGIRRLAQATGMTHRGVLDVRARLLAAGMIEELEPGSGRRSARVRIDLDRIAGQVDLLDVPRTGERASPQEDPDSGEADSPQEDPVPVSAPHHKTDPRSGEARSVAVSVVPSSGERASPDPPRNHSADPPKRVLTGGEVPEAPVPEPEPENPDDEIPKWARASKGRPKGWTPTDVLRVVAEVDTVLRGRPPNVERLGTAAKAILALARVDGGKPAEFSADLVRVVRAAADCKEGIFARDIRAEGWSGGTNRSTSIATLTVQDRWSDRLAAAKRHEAGQCACSATPTGPRAGAARGAPTPDELRELEQW